MAEYIEREAAYEKCGWYNTVNGKSVYAVRKDELAAIPAADVEPVRHGRWVDKMVRDWHCSECRKKVPRQVYFDGYCYDDKLKYCPNCGARMDLEVSE